MTVYLVPDDPKYDAIGFDVTEQENHIFTSALTSNAVEDGSVVNDHLAHAPDTFSCTVVTSQSPTSTTFFGDGQESQAIPLRLFEAKRTSPFSPVVVSQSTISAAGFQSTRKANLVQEMLERLLALQKDGVTMTVITTVREYTSMLLTSNGLPRGARSIGSGRFNLEFNKLRIVTTQSVNAPAPKEPRGKGSSAKGPAAPDGGGKETLPAPGDNRSVAAQLLDMGKKWGL